MFKIDRHNLKSCTIDNIHDILTRSLIEGDKVITVSREFASLPNDVERIKFVTDLFEKFDIKIPVTTVAKDDDKSVKVRNRGNDAYKNKQYMHALSLYNESIALASEGSESIALAYANRSAILMHFKKYNSCLEDIARAEKYYPTDLLHKLLTRRKKCEELNKASSYKKIPPPIELFLGPNEEMPCASAALTLQYTENLGRHIVAKCNIPAGSIIAQETAYCTSLLHQLRYERCTFCLGKSFTLIPCPHCPEAMFCDEKCFDEAMKRHHKIECAIWPSLIALDLTKVQLLSCRVAVSALAGCDSDIKSLKQTVDEIEHSNNNKRTAGFTRDANGAMKYDSESYAPIHSLITNTERRLPADLFYRAVVATGVLQLVRDHTDFGRDFDDSDCVFFGSLLLRHLQTSACNMHTIEMLSDSSDEDVQLGNGAYAFHSLINHSCAPNASRHNWQLDGRRVMTMVAMLPIAAGEQICDNYGFHYAMSGRDERRSGLEQQYLFRCECIACLDNYPTYWSLPHLSNAPRPIIPEPDMKKLQEHNRPFARKQLPKYMSQLNALAQHRPYPNIQICDLQESAKQCLSILSAE